MIIWSSILGFLSYLSISFFSIKTLVFISLIMGFFFLLNWVIEDMFMFLNLETWKIWILLLTVMSYLMMLFLSQDNSMDILMLKSLVFLGSLGIMCFNHLILIYVSLELQTFSLFILISKDSYSMKSMESSLKYFILGAISSGFFLISMTSIYNYSGTLNLNELSFMSFNNNFFWVWWYLLLFSILFKLGLFPLHFWIPDIYEGSSIEVLLMLSTLPKMSIFVFFMNLKILASIVFYIGLSSIIVGALGGMNQSKLKRLLGYSGISHLGFLFLVLGLNTWFSLEIAMVYLTIYILTILTIFIIMTMLPLNRDMYIIELSGLSYKNPSLAFCWSCLFLSIAGLPPLAGFIIKWWMIWEMIINNYMIIGIFSILLSSFSMAYYLSLNKIVYFQKFFSFMMWDQVFNLKKENYFLMCIIGIILYINLFMVIHPTFFMNMIYYIFYL